MPTALGYRTIAGWRREPLITGPTWPAAAASVVQTMIPVRAVRGNEGTMFAFNATTEHGRGPDSADLLTVFPGETWDCRLHYQGFEQMLACSLGYQAKRLNNVLQPQLLATGVYRHIFEVDDTLGTVTAWTENDGFTSAELGPALYRVRRGTAAVWRQVSVWETLSTMVNRLTLRGTVTDGVTAEFDLLGYTRSRTSVVNTASIMQALAVNHSANVLFRHGVWRMVPWSATTALQASDAFAVTEWSLEIDNHLTAVAGPRTGTAPEEYERAEPPTITLELTIPRYQEDSAWTRLLGSTVLMGDAVFMGPSLGGGYNAECTFAFPQFHLTDVTADVQGPAPGMPTYRATMEVPRSAPAGFPATHHLGSLVIQLINGVSTHALLD